MQKEKKVTLNNHPYCSNKNCRIPSPEILNRLKQETKKTWKQLADIYQVGERTLRRHARQSEKEKQKVKQKRGRKKIIDGRDLIYLRNYTIKLKTITQKLLAGRFSWNLRKKISQATICRALKRAGVVYKKFTYQASEQLWLENRNKIKHFLEVTLPHLLKIEANIFFLDESGFRLNMVPPRGYYLRGPRLFGIKPGKRGENRSLILLAQITNGEKIIHWRTIEGGVNSKKFHQFLTDFSPPNNGKRNVLIMDNLSSHHATKSCIKLGLSTIEELARSKVIEIIFLPSYTPEINPIEKMNNIIKQHARAKQARKKEKLDSVIEEKIKIFKEEDTVKYLDNSIKECLDKLASADGVNASDYKCWLDASDWESWEPKEDCCFTKMERINVKIDDMWEGWENGHLNWIL
ncbi:MAG: IS630 family transposase [Candidatus Moeniiplasma glomeromycotorum]|nr:IS630 family transposase [Candidatus Moeniiplasma glomeromycotorum]MCE8167705.1 IS630 family transposase [Candidatus Moeniiplasma glomeromycotorum]MCE8169254.1 IS630 family transposase [Candidatus Moeniiplasma glomeromycotorum]